MNANLDIATDAGNDIIRTWGASSWTINAGETATTRCTLITLAPRTTSKFNQGRATWVLNTADQAGILAAERDIDDLISDTNDNYALYQSTVTVNLRGH